jgi:hypothetical protein
MVIFGCEILEMLLPQFFEQVVALDQPVGEGLARRGLLFGVLRRGSSSRISLSFGGRAHGKVLGGFGSHGEGLWKQ